MIRLCHRVHVMIREGTSRLDSWRLLCRTAISQTSAAIASVSLVSC